jgi:cyclophilin family peptidyl-prolyl cis-trans isomerase
MKRLLALLLFASLVAGCATPSAPSAASTPPPAPAEPPPGPDDGLFAEITTPRGLIVCELYFRTMPLTVTSFVGLAEGTLGPAPRKPFFDGLTFHRVVPGFVIQGGDPTGTGRGSPGYRFPDEFAAGQRHDGPGLLSMANSGPDTNGSQFFITLGAARYLDYNHAIFGRVTQGAEFLPQVQPRDAFSVKIIRRGRAAERFRADDTAFNELLARAPRWQPPHFEDKTSLVSGPAPWQARYVENRLANLARFTGRRIYVRLLDTFTPDPAGQTAQQFVDALAEKIPHRDVLLACYFADEDKWLLSGAPAGMTLPIIAPPEPSSTPASSAEAAARQRQSRLYKTVEQVVSGLIDQTDPK